MPLSNVLWPEAYCFCPVAEYLTHFHQTYINSALWDSDERVIVWSQWLRSQWNEICWKQHFVGLLIRCLEKYLSDFHQTYTNDVL